MLQHAFKEWAVICQALADGKTLDDILVPAFATVREAAKRVLGPG